MMWFLKLSGITTSGGEYVYPGHGIILSGP